MRFEIHPSDLNRHHIGRNVRDHVVLRLCTCEATAVNSFMYPVVCVLMIWVEFCAHCCGMPCNSARLNAGIVFSAVHTKGRPKPCRICVVFVSL